MITYNDIEDLIDSRMHRKLLSNIEDILTLLENTPQFNNVAYNLMNFLIKIGASFGIKKNIFLSFPDWYWEFINIDFIYNNFLLKNSNYFISLDDEIKSKIISRVHRELFEKDNIDFNCLLCYYQFLNYSKNYDIDYYTDIPYLNKTISIILSAFFIDTHNNILFNGRATINNLFNLFLSIEKKSLVSFLNSYNLRSKLIIDNIAKDSIYYKITSFDNLNKKMDIEIFEGLFSFYKRNFEIDNKELKNQDGQFDYSNLLLENHNFIIPEMLYIYYSYVSYIINLESNSEYILAQHFKKLDEENLFYHYLSDIINYDIVNSAQFKTLCSELKSKSNYSLESKDIFFNYNVHHYYLFCSKNNLNAFDVYNSIKSSLVCVLDANGRWNPKSEKLLYINFNI